MSIWYLFQVFSAFGFVHKIATFEKAAGFQVRDQILVLHIFEISFDFLCYSQLCDISWQALIQFTDADTASSARNALDGRSIPRHALLLRTSTISYCACFDCNQCRLSRNIIWNLLILCHDVSIRYLLPEHVGSCHLRISYSAHTDLNIKFQSHRSR